MKILSIELIGFKRFLLNQIEHFQMVINNPMQVILGTNGSGKSSLLQQLTPLPPNANDFIKTGSKLITISHQDSIYNLKSVFQPSQKHSFIKDDVELNLGGTITVQRELVKTYFNITQEIHSLMLGEESFDSMSASRRKEWFILLCDTNYDYAINVYTKLKERHRDVTGALKISKKKLINETEKVLKTDEEEKIKNEVQELYNELNFLLEYRKPIESDLDILTFKHNELDTQLKKCSNSLNVLMKDNLVIQNTEFYTLRINKANEKIVKIKTLINSTSVEFNQNQEKINILQKTEENTAETLKRKLELKTFQKNDLEEKLLFIKNSYDAKSAINSFLSISTTLAEIFTAIPVNIDKKYSNDNLNKNKELLNNLVLEKKQTHEKMDSFLSKQKHMLAHKGKPDIDCPNCNFKFSIHYNEQVLNDINSKITKLELYLETELNPKIKIHEDYIQDCVAYGSLYRQYVQCVNNFKILSPYWEYLNDKNIITDNPQYGVTLLTLIEKDLQNQIIYNDYIKDCTELNSMLVSLKDVGSIDLKTLVKCNVSLQNAIEGLTDSLQVTLKMKETYTVAMNRNKEAISLKNKIKEIADKKFSLCEQEIEYTRRSIFNQTVKLLQSKLASKEHILSSVKTQKDIINSITLNINELSSEEEALTLLVKQLSPIDGLIAEGLYGFINNFVNQMNNLIKKVWTYPMEVKSCELTDDNLIELDYKFPIWLVNNVVPDVSKGSNGMIEIINLAFKVVALKFLNLQNMPLMLDEMGKTLDNAHRQGIVTLIKQMVEQHIFTQTFMVSHDFSQYSAMVNVDTCVLSPENILLPEHYNEHVKFIKI